MRILVDIDGVLAEQVPPALARYNAAQGTVYTKADIVTYNEPIGDTDISALIAAVDVEHMPVVRGARAAMKTLTEKHRVILVTARPGALMLATERWMMKHDIPFYGALTGIKDKARVVGDILIDDYTGHVNAFGVTGRKAILFDQPWNRNDKLHPLVTRCCGWSEVLETIREWEVMHP